MSTRTGLLIVTTVAAALGLLVFFARPRIGSQGRALPSSDTVLQGAPPSQVTANERQPLLARTDGALAVTEAAAIGGQLRFLDIGTLVAPPATRWVLRGTTRAATVDLNVPADGLAIAPPGLWRLQNVDDGWVAVEDEVALLEGVTETVWVARAEPFRVHVLSTLGGPIAAAAVLWIANSSAEEEGLVTRTDADGVATIEPGVQGPGRCLVSAPGFASETVSLLPDPTLEVRVFLWPETVQSIPVLVVDAETGVPHGGLEAISNRGYVGTTDERGALEVPADAQSLTIRGDGVFATRFDSAAFGEGVLRVPRRSLVDLHLETGEGQPSPGVVFPRLIEAPTRCNGSVVFDDAGHAVPDSGSAVLAMPAGAVVDLFALDPASAAEGHAVLRPLNDEEQAVVVMEPGPRLRIFAESAGAPVGRAWARVRFRGGASLALRPDADGALCVPLSKPITLIRVGAPGYLSTVLKPRDKSGVDAEGSLRLSLASSHRIALRLADETGAPAIGAELRFSERRTGLHQHPDLGGAWPTTHPQWIERVDDDIATTSGADGTATVTLAAGTYIVWVDVPAPLQIEIARSATFTQSFQFTVERDDTFDCVVRGPRRVSLSVFDARSMAPVRGFTVVAPSGLPGASDEASGNLWQGWVGTTTNRLIVQASGFLGGEVALPAGRGIFTADVLLTPTGGTHICLAGDSAALLGKAIEIQLFRWSGVEPELVWQERRVVSDVCLDAHLPFDDAWVRLDLSESGTGLRCVPDRLEMSAGRELVFEVRE